MIEQVDQRMEIEALLAPLQPRSRDIVLRFYGVGCPRQNMKEIARDYEVSHARIVQIRNKALRQMKYISQHGRERFLKTRKGIALRAVYFETNRARD